MEYFYLDTSCLMRRAESLLAGANARSLNTASKLESVLESASNAVYISEVTLVEFHSNICTYLRCLNPEYVKYDDAWFDKARLQVMSEIQQGVLKVLPLPPRAIELAMTYVETATREHGRKFKSWDAVHLNHAGALAASKNTRVTIVSTDGDFAGFLQMFPAFEPYVQVLNPAV